MSSSGAVKWKQVFSPTSLIFTILGILFAVIAFRGFMIPNHFIDGGVTGLSILISEVLHINIAIPIIVFNIPFIWIGYRKIGKTFAVQSLLAVLLLALAIQFIHIPVITEDKVLIAAFGGLFIGLGIGFVIRGGGVVDGMEVLAVYTDKNTKFSSSEIIIAINTLIFIGLAFAFGVDTAMYSTITFFAAIKTADYVVDGFEKYTALTIVSKEYEEIKRILVNDFGKAISVYKGERGYLPDNFEVRNDCDILVTVVTRLEIYKLQNKVYEIDSNAFIYAYSLKDVKGGVVKKRKHH